MRRSWKTTAAGLVTAAFAFVLFSPDLFVHYPWLIALAKFATVGGLGSVGILAQDHSKGGN